MYSEYVMGDSDKSGIRASHVYHSTHIFFSFYRFQVIFNIFLFCFLFTLRAPWGDIYTICLSSATYVTPESDTYVTPESDIYDICDDMGNKRR